MFKKKTTAEPTKLDLAIESALDDLNGYTAETEEHEKISARLTDLYALKAQDKPDRVSSDTAALVASNLIGILVVVGYERAHIMTTKAFSLATKLR